MTGIDIGDIILDYKREKGSMNLRKILASVILILSLVLSGMTAFATDVSIDNIKVPFNDSTGYPFISAEGRTMVPLRATMEAYGATVRWDAEQSTAIVTKGVTTVTCKIGESAIYRNGTKIVNDAAATVVNGRTYLPIRVVLEALDAKVSWDGNVKVESPGAGTLIYNIENSGKRVSNYWKAWENALALKNSGNYAAAIEKIIEVAPVFLEKSGYNSDAMLYHNLGECYNALGMVDETVACYRREADYWALAGKTQENIDALRRADLSGSTVQVFVTSKNAEYSARRNFGTIYAPASGIQFGVTLKGSNPSYMDQFTNLVGKEAAGYLLYGHTDLSPYAHAFRAAAERGKIIQYALQVQNLNDLLSITAEDWRYVKLAQDIQATGAKTLIRFACEMNDETSKWYTEDYNSYIQRFRYVADIFHKYAPNCAMVWSPNFYPANNMELYYPGDAYVDYVGISLYAEHQPETDPLKLGVDRSRFASLLDTLVSLYGHKKPIMISECGASYVDKRTGADLTEFSSRQLKDLFTYLPIKYPGVVAAYLFETQDAGGRKFEFSGNYTYYQTYKNAIANNAYISGEASSYADYSFEVGNNVSVPGEMISIHSYIKTLHNDFAYVVYSLNGVDIGTGYGIPFTLNVDFSPYKGKTLELMTRAFDSKGALVAKKTYTINVK